MTSPSPDTPEDDLDMIEDDDDMAPRMGEGMPTNEETAARFAQSDPLEDAAAINERLANLPREFEFNGRTWKVQSHPMRRVIELDREVVKLQKLINTPVGGVEELAAARTDPDKQMALYDAMSERNDDAWAQLVKCVVLIVNGPDTPTKDAFTEEDVQDLTLEDANSIVESYVSYTDSQALLGNVLEARSF